jgi:hypothetical protein
MARHSEHSSLLIVLFRASIGRFPPFEIRSYLSVVLALCESANRVLLR